MKILNTTKRCFRAGVTIAGLLVSASTLADEGTLNLANIVLKAASGYPNAVEQKFEFTGVLYFIDCDNCVGQSHNGWAKISGSWDGHSQEAIEAITYDGEIKGNVIAHLKCNENPWMIPTACAKIDIKVTESGSPWWINWDGIYSEGGNPVPITASVVWAHGAEAKAMSDAAANNQPPPPPPPPQNKKLVFNNVEFAMTHTQSIKKPSFKKDEIKDINPLPEPSDKAVGRDVITKNIPIITQEKPVSPRGEITSITITPSSNVMVGTKVTVKINGNGSCALMIDTNGASDEGNNIDKFELPFGNLPRKIWFQAKKTGTFKIQVSSEHSGSHGCKSIGMGGNAQLTVYGQIDKDEIKDINPLPKQTVKITKPGEIRGFNPQPEPPGKAVGRDVITKNIPIITQEKPVSPNGEITSITITPSSNVMVGTKVTVKINGNGSCALMIDTNGASDEGNNIDVFKLPFGNFPRKIWFQAKKTGTFKIQASSDHSGSHGCKPTGMGGVAQLKVYDQINRRKVKLR